MWRTLQVSSFSNHSYPYSKRCVWNIADAASASGVCMSWIEFFFFFDETYIKFIEIRISTSCYFFTIKIMNEHSLTTRTSTKTLLAQHRRREVFLYTDCIVQSSFLIDFSRQRPNFTEPQFMQNTSLNFVFIVYRTRNYKVEWQVPNAYLSAAKV